MCMILAEENKLMSNTAPSPLRSSQLKEPKHKGYLSCFCNLEQATATGQLPNNSWSVGEHKVSLNDPN